MRPWLRAAATEASASSRRAPLSPRQSASSAKRLCSILALTCKVMWRKSIVCTQEVLPVRQRLAVLVRKPLFLYL